MEKSYKPHCSSLGGVSANLMAVLALVAAYFLGWGGLVLAVLLLVLEKNSRLTRYYAAMGIIFWAVKAILSTFTSIMDGMNSVGHHVFGSVFSMFRFGSNMAMSITRAALFVMILCATIYGAVKAYKWIEWRPVIVGKAVDWLLEHVGDSLYNGGDDPVPPGCEHRMSADSTFQQPQDDSGKKEDSPQENQDQPPVE